MRGVLEKYNELLRQTFIDIPFLEKPYLQYKGKKHNVNQHSKLVKRIFSKGSFNKGGRFYGGWWQRIGEKERENILMDDRETLEFDYTSLHPVLAYAKIGIDISINQFDAYDIPFDRIKDKKDKRKIVKSLFLTALNAKNEKECFKAFRNQWNYIEHPYVGSFSDIFLKELLDSLKEHHPKIVDMFCNQDSTGLDLMRWDGDIVEFIVIDFNERNIPFICIHNFFIVWKEQQDLLLKKMHTAIKRVTGGIVDNAKIKFDGYQTIDFQKQVLSYVGKTALDRDYYLLKIGYLQKNIDRCKGYIERLEKHKSYFHNKYNNQ